MTATTQDRNTPFKDGELIVAPVAASVKILAGTLVAANAAGFATPGATSTTLAYLGMADANIDNSAGADGALTVPIRRGKALKWANDGGDPVTQASLGRPCFIVDNQTVAKTNGTNTRSQAGIVVALDADGVWVI
ncbi:hypothetical protein [Craterilacuibacter sinensis]|uniref:DUF2190 domain-containing protein n=1 Tax=Craterilacuibacter sinensis TaxID=2686017 RepID=A0A845BN75_9NEIS|nr:hypothetical protein [Craterilacuibacter sinensis]MXR36714.1 hypothetical protein [Craterilacuibacter sinensis]